MKYKINVLFKTQEPARLENFIMQVNSLIRHFGVRDAILPSGARTIMKTMEFPRGINLQVGKHNSEDKAFKMASRTPKWRLFG